MQISLPGYTAKMSLSYLALQLPVEKPEDAMLVAHMFKFLGEGEVEKTIKTPGDQPQPFVTIKYIGGGIFFRSTL